MTWFRADDRGSITPLILVFFLVAALLVMGAAAAGSAFLAQRDLQAVCDGAAVRAANAVDPAGAYA
ncbi:MAG: pilus assembly protein TadG-related protein, partial [Actinomycetota bacterium]|nr:pilus assembly protein TadG-related protein [Actinomycetota bacterium]